MRLSLSVARAAPLRYAAWVVGGTARATGRLLATNLPFVLALAALAVLYRSRCGGAGWGRPGRPLATTCRR